MDPDRYVSLDAVCAALPLSSAVRLRLTEHRYF
jgi:hypothetical protein